MPTVQSSETRNRDHDCKNDPTDGTEESSTKIKCDSVTQTHKILIDIIGSQDDQDWGNNLPYPERRNRICSQPGRVAGGSSKFGKCLQCPTYRDDCHTRMNSTRNITFWVVHLASDVGYLVPTIKRPESGIQCKWIGRGTTTRTFKPRLVKARRGLPAG